MEIYPTLQEKAANLLYLITKNHSFLDGNKRIAATMFLYFLDRNGILYDEDGGKKIVDPAMADNGKLYPAFDEAFAAEMAKRLARNKFVLEAGLKPEDPDFLERSLALLDQEADREIRLGETFTAGWGEDAGRVYFAGGVAPDGPAGAAAPAAGLAPEKHSFRMSLCYE